ncbi:MAG: metallophosphatase family protein [Thermoplasmata archaeon]|nr:metallophosphatase family protein [Thermoplasmata archaeon]
MRLAVLSDVHANLPALQAVLADVDHVAPEQIWVAGDLVGYNPWPNEVLEILRERHVRAIRGNHERAVLGGTTFAFNELAATAVKWTRIHMTPASVGYLNGLEDRTRATLPEATVAMYHGSPRDDDEYVFPWLVDEVLLQVAAAPYVILGHTHLPMARRFRSGFIVNPGSVGQPRDRDPRAAWGVLDLTRRTFEVRRVSYDIDHVAGEIRKAGLPNELAHRLYAGI